MIALSVTSVWTVLQAQSLPQIDQDAVSNSGIMKRDIKWALVLARLENSVSEMKDLDSLCILMQI